MTVLVAVLLALAPQTTPVQALGQAPITQGNRAAAHDRALAAALAQAVEQALTFVVDPAARQRAADRLRREVVARARTYVPSYRVLDERELPGDLYQVQLEAQVDTTALRADAVAIAGAGASPGTPPPARPGAGGRPRVLLLVGADALEPVRAALLAHGFPEAEAPAGASPRSDAEAAERAHAAGAGLVIVATVRSEDEKRLRGLELSGARAEVELRAIGADGRSLGRGAARERGFAETLPRAIAQATRQAAVQAARALMDELGEKASPSAPSSEGGVLVDVVGPRTVHELETIEPMLEKLPGAQSVVLRRLGGGVAVYQVRTTQPAAAIAQALRAQGETIEATSDREVRVRMVKAGP
jgi:hypothetical protein